MHTLLRSLTALALGAPLIAGCQAAWPGSSVTGASMAIGAPNADQVVEALMAKDATSWQDASLTYPPLLARREASRYRVKATAMGGSTWTLALPARSSSGMAYRRLSMDSYEGPDPRMTESVYALTESEAGTPQVLRLAAVDGGTLNHPGWDALANLSSPGTFQRTAVVLSADARRLYMLTSGGYFICLDADTGTRLFAQKLSNAGFAGTAPFIDYSNGGGAPAGPLGSDEFLYAASNDGSVYRVRIKDGAFTVTAWPAGGGKDAPLWPGRPTIPYGQATAVNAFPIAWQSRLYVGTTDGRCVRVDVTTDTPKLTTWRPDLLTSASYRGITAPVAIDFDANFAVSHLFVPCGDRLVWIDTAQPVAEEAAVASPPLVLTKTSPVQGALSAHPYDAPLVKGPYDCIDFISIATKKDPAPSRWGNGTGVDGRLFGADGYTTPTDGNGILGYMQFQLPVGDFVGYAPTSARIDLSAAANAASEETIDVYRASNYRPGTNGYWSGMNFTPDVDYFNRPLSLSGRAGGYKGGVSASDATTGLPRYGLQLSDALPVDRPNVEGMSWHPFAMVSVGKQRANPPSAPESSEAAKWHRAIDGDNKTEPKLYVTLDTAANTPTANGVQTQPSVDSIRAKVWVVASNALFELSYANRNVFQAKSSVTYSLTAAGRGVGGAVGPTSNESPRRYVMPKGNVLYTGSRLVVADADPVNNRFFVNQYQSTLQGASDSLLHHYDAAAGSGQVGEAMLFDYWSGSAYLTTSGKSVSRVDIL